MKRLTCEMCGSTDIIKQDGVFVCQSCGCKYSVEEAKKMMVEGTVEVQGTVKVDNSISVDALLKRVFLFLEDGDFTSAEEYCEKVLDLDPECAEAYLCKFMVDLRVKNKEDLKDCNQIFDDYENYQKFLRFSNGSLKNEIEDYANCIRNKKISLEEKSVAIDKEIKNLTELIDLEKNQLDLKEKELNSEKSKELDCEKDLKIQYNIIEDIKKECDSLGLFKKAQKKEYQERLNNIEIPKYNELKKLVFAEREKHLDTLNNKLQLFELERKEREKREKDYNKRIEALKHEQVNIKIELNKFLVGKEKVIKVGAFYNGVVTRLVSFGAFVEIAPGKEGLVHISKLDVKRTEKVEDCVNVGDNVIVKVTEMDNLGRFNLSRRDALVEVEGLVPEN